jgi:ribonucleoside-diphosphate reductase alpha chain
MEKFSDMKFEPAGFTDFDGYRIAKSIPDYVFHWLEITGVSKGLKHMEEMQALPSPAKGDVQISASHDGPPCTKCGNMTKRAGSCYCCTSCGTTTGCS